MMEFWRLILDKFKWNVLILAGMVTFLTLEFAQMLVPKLPNLLSAEILALLIGIAIGGLISTMSQLFSSPSVPIEAYNAMLDKIPDKE